jgi:hypothetical protein
MARPKKEVVIKEVNENFLNPFTSGVSYADFLNAIPDGITVRKYCEGNLTEDETNWIENEIEHFDNNNSEPIENLETEN